MKIITKCPECGTIYKGTIGFDFATEHTDEWDEVITLSEPCPYCKKADKMAKEVLGDLYLSIDERK